MSVIEYFYSAHSAYAYLGSARLSEICAAYEVRLIHRPILLSPVVKAQRNTPFADRTQAHVDYFLDEKSNAGPSIAMLISSIFAQRFMMQTIASRQA